MRLSLRTVNPPLGSWHSPFRRRSEILDVILGKPILRSERSGEPRDVLFGLP